jgi:importin subunit alpha-1/8
MRQRRQEVSIELRKNKKEDQLLKRRNIEAVEPTSPLQESNGQSPAASMTLEEIVTNIRNPNPSIQFQAVQAVRKMLSRERNPPIDTVIGMGLVPTLINFLEDFSK